MKSICADKTFSCILAPIVEEGYVNIYGRDITEKKARGERIARLTKLYAVLSRVNEAIVRIHDEQSLYQEVCRIIAEEGEFPLVWLGQIQDRRVVPAASCGPAADYLNEIRLNWRANWVKARPAPAFAKTGWWSTTTSTRIP